MGGSIIGYYRERWMQPPRRSPHSISLDPTCRNHRPDVSAMLTTMAFDHSRSRWLGIGDLIAEPEGPSSISSTVAQRRVDRRCCVTQDPIRTLIHLRDR